MNELAREGKSQRHAQSPKRARLFFFSYGQLRSDTAKSFRLQRAVTERWNDSQKMQDRVNRESRFIASHFLGHSLGATRFPASAGRHSYVLFSFSLYCDQLDAGNQRMGTVTPRLRAHNLIFCVRDCGSHRSCVCAWAWKCSSLRVRTHTFSFFFFYWPTSTLTLMLAK